MRLRWTLLAVLPLLAAFVALACRGGGSEQNIDISFPTPTPTQIPTPTPTAVPTPSPTPSPTPKLDVCGHNPDPVPAGELQVQEPLPGEKIRNPFHLRGWGSEIAFENSGVIVALIDATGAPLPEKRVPPESRAGRIAPPGLKITDFTAPFATDILVQGLSAPTPYCIWLFLETTPEGVPKKVLQVPVTVTP